MAVSVKLAKGSEPRLGGTVSFDVTGAPKTARIRVIAHQDRDGDDPGLVYAAEGASLAHEFTLGREGIVALDEHGRPFPTSTWERNGGPAVCTVEVWREDDPHAVEHVMLATLDFQAAG